MNNIEKYPVTSQIVPLPPRKHQWWKSGCGFKQTRFGVKHLVRIWLIGLKSTDNFIQHVTIFLVLYLSQSYKLSADISQNLATLGLLYIICSSCILNIMCNSGIHSKSIKVCGVQVFSHKKFAEEVRKSRHLKMCEY